MDRNVSPETGNNSLHGDGFEQTRPPNPGSGGKGFSFAQVANHLNISPDTLRRLTRRFDRHLSDGIYAPEPTFSGPDVAALVTVQQLLSQGYDDEQIHEQLTPRAAIHSPGTTGNHTPGTLVENEHTPLHTGPAPLGPVGTLGATGLPKPLHDALDTLVNGQKAVLNSQSSLRDMIGVVAQDNFNLKEENRKLRERMLELERTQAENLRREEARRERIDNRLRALEATVGALQQQVAQLVQIQRRPPPRKRGWFG